MRNVQWMVVAALSTALACGDSSSDKDSAGDGGTSSGGSDSGGASSGGGGSGGGASSGSCAPGAAPADYGSCSEAQVKEYQACFEDACGSQLEACYGAGYKNGKYGGPCKDYIACTTACACDDLACIQKCKPSTECTDCTQGLSSCSFSCVGKLECAYADSGLSFGDGGITVGDATISFGGTCQDLSDCCDTLAADEKSNCTMAYDAIKANGDVACGFLVSEFCP